MLGHDEQDSDLALGKLGRVDVLSCGNNCGEAKYKQLWETNNKPNIRSNHMYQRTLSEVYKLKPGVGGIFWEKKRVLNLRAFPTGMTVCAAVDQT